jgi:two-component system, NarL family, sensor kinase
VTGSVSSARGVLAWAAPAVCATLLVASLLIGRDIDAPPELTEPEVLVLVPASLGFSVVGALILTRHPRHHLGWLYAGTAIAMATALFAFVYAWRGLVAAPGQLPGALAAGWVSAWVWTLGFAPAMTFGLLLYPDGRLPSRRWWPAALVSGLAVGGLLAGTAFVPGPLVNHPVADNPLGIPGIRGVMEVIGSAAQPLVLVGFAAGVASLVARWRRAPVGGVDRRQITLLALASAAALAVVLVPSGSGPAPWPVIAAILAVFALVPAAIGVAILRHGLFDIDVVLNRSLVYGGLTIGIVGLYAGLVWAAARPLGTGTAASLLATGVAAAAVLPLHTRLQRIVDRAMYGERGDPYAAVSRLTTRLQGASAPGESLAAVAEAIAVSLRLPFVAVEAAGGATASHGVSTGTHRHVLDLSHQGNDVGRLVVEGRDGESLTTRERALLVDLARPAGAAVHAAGLADALRTSQRRLVRAREEERRRLRRDLHDGLGPTLASVVLGLDAAAGLVETDPAGARGLLAQLKSEAGGAVDDIRRLVYDLRPPALDELGLLGAVRQQAERLSRCDSSMDVNVSAAGPLPRLGAATEVAAYRIALEAVTNAVRHAHARHCSVLLAADGELRVEVIDDGTGIATVARPGVGLAAMQERATEVGGRCVVSSAVPAGTRVLALLPLDPP